MGLAAFEEFDGLVDAPRLVVGDGAGGVESLAEAG